MVRQIGVTRARWRLNEGQNARCTTARAAPAINYFADRRQHSHNVSDRYRGCSSAAQVAGPDHADGDSRALAIPGRQTRHSIAGAVADRN